MRQLKVILLIISGLFLVYSEGFFQRYLISDDYFLLYDVNGSNVYISSGRPVSYFVCNIYRMIYESTGIGGAYIPRLISIIGLVILGYLLYRIFVRYRMPHYYSMFLSFAIINIPCYLLYIIWISLNPAVFSSIAAVLAFICTLKCQKYRKSYLQLILYSLLTIVLMVCSIGFYQPAAMIYFSLIVLDVFMQRTENPIRLMVFPGFRLFLGGFAMGVYFLVYKFSLYILKMGKNQRAEFPTSYLEKFKFFWGDVVPRASNVFDVFQTPGQTQLLLILLISGVCLYPFMARIKLKFYLLRLSVLPVAMMMSYAPNLMTKVNYPCFRTLLGPTACVLIMYGIFFHAITRGWKPKTKNVLMLAFSIYIAYHCHVLNSKYLIYPATQELNFIVNTIHKKYFEMVSNDQNVKTIYFIPTEGGIVDSDHSVFGEFGVNSTSQSWNSKYAVMLALQILKLKPSNYNILVAPRDKIDLKSNSNIVVDMGPTNLLQSKWRN